jgi:hypothetical protein
VARLGRRTPFRAFFSKPPLPPPAASVGFYYRFLLVRGSEGMIFVQSEGTAARRRAWLYLVDATDGITAETGEAAGQPQISKNLAAWANTSATLTAVGNGTYYVELTAAELDTLGQVSVRYKSAATAEFSVTSNVVAMNIHDTVRAGLTALPNAAAEAAGGLYTRGTGAGQINQPANGLVDVNVENWNTTAVPVEHTAGYPIVTIKDGTGTGEINTNAGAIVLVDTTTVINGATSAAATDIRALASGTSDSGTTTTMVDASRTEADADYWVGALIVFTSGNILGQARYITAFTPGTDTITFSPATTQAVATQTYEIWQTADFLRPTTSGRTLDVSSTGEAGIDWNNVGTQGATVSLSATTVNLVNTLTTYTGNTVQTGDSFARLGAPSGSSVSADILVLDNFIDIEIADIQARLPAALVSGRMDSSVGAMAANVLTATAINSGAITSAKFAAGAIDAAAIADGAIDRATFAADTGLQSIRSNTAQAGAAGTITLDASASAVDDFYNDTVVLLTGATGAGQVRHISDYVGSTKVATIKPSWVTNPDVTSTFAILPMVSVWDNVMADHLDSGSTGASLNAAGGAGDPWTTTLPGAYGAGTAGKIVGDNINATISSRASQASVDDVDNFIDTEIADIQARLPAALVSGRMDSSVGAMAANVITAGSMAADASTEIRSLASGTSDSGTTTTMVDAARTESDTDYWVGGLIVFTSGTISGQARYITAFTPGTDTITFAPATTQAVGTQTYEIWPTADFLRPTTTGRTLDVSSTGEAGLDWNNVGTQGATVNLAATTINLVNTLTTYTGNTVQTGDSFARLGAPSGVSVSADILVLDNFIDTEIADIQARIPAALVSGRMDSSVGAMAANVVTAAAIADGAIDRATFAADTGLQSIRSNTAQAGAAGTITLDASASAVDDFYNDTVILLTGGTGVGQVRHVSDYVGSTKVATIKPSWVTNPDVTSTFAILPMVSVWDNVMADHLDSGSTGASLNAAGGAGDPWTTALPGAYGAGTAGKIVGDNVNATISSRASQTTLDTLDNLVDTEVADIQARLPAALTAGGNMKSDVLALDGGTGAATNAEKFFDGTGYGPLLQRTTIATLASQTSFTLTAGSADNDAYNGCVLVVEDSATAAQKCVAIVKDYTGSTKTVTLLIDPAVFTMAVGDTVTLMATDMLMRYVAAACAGQLSGGGTATEVMKDVDSVTTRLTASVDASGNRTAITYG